MVASTLSPVGSDGAPVVGRTAYGQLVRCQEFISHAGAKVCLHSAMIVAKTSSSGDTVDAGTAVKTVRNITPRCTACVLLIVVATYLVSILFSKEISEQLKKHSGANDFLVATLQPLSLSLSLPGSLVNKLWTTQL